MKLFSKRHAIGAKPGALILSASSPAPVIRVMRYGSGSLEEYQAKDVTELSPEDPRGVQWIDVQGLGDLGVLQSLAERFGIHPLALSDAVNTPQRPKSQSFPGLHLIVARMFRLGEDHEDIEGDIVEQVSIMVLPHCVITMQEHYGDILDPVRERIRDVTSNFRNRGSDYLGYAILDTIIDGYFPILEATGDRLEDLEERALDDPTPSVLRELAAERMRLVALRRALLPMREALRSLTRDADSIFCEEVRLFFRDTFDHVLQLSDVVESYRELVAGTMNTYLSAVSNRTNDVMRVLTLMASVFIPLTFVAGIYGMNFDHMPELHADYGYPIALGVMGVLAVGMLWYFRSRGWLGGSDD